MDTNYLKLAMALCLVAPLSLVGCGDDDTGDDDDDGNQMDSGRPDGGKAGTGSMAGMGAGGRAGTTANAGSGGMFFIASAESSTVLSFDFNPTSIINVSLDRLSIRPFMSVNSAFSHTGTTFLFTLIGFWISTQSFSTMFRSFIMVPMD